MIVVVRRRNIALIVMLFLLSIAIYSLNIGNAEEAEPVTAGLEVLRTVIVDAGHGGEDPGAVSDYSGVREKDVNLIIAKKVKALLEQQNYKVILTREEDKLSYEEGTTGILRKRYQDLTRRKKLIDESGADIAISIHLNKFDQTSVHGAQTFYPRNNYEESQKLAVAIQSAIKETVDPENKREALMKDKDILLLKNIKVPTVMVECGFLSNPDEEKKLVTEEYQDKLAQAIVNGINKYFGR